MGRQSARLYYQGMDHKDIYYQGNFHDAMYLGNELLWEKLSDLIIVSNFPITGYLAHDEDYVYISYSEDIWKIKISDWRDNSFLGYGVTGDVVAADCMNGLSVFFTKDAYFIKNEDETCTCVPSNYPSGIENITGCDICIVGGDIYGASRIKQNGQQRLLISTISGSYRVHTQYGYYGYPRLCKGGNTCFVGCDVAESVLAETGDLILLKYSGGSFSEVWKKSTGAEIIHVDCMLQLEQSVLVATGNDTGDAPPTLYYIGTETKTEILKDVGRVLSLTCGNGYIVGVLAFYSGYSYHDACVMYKKPDDVDWKYKDLGGKRRRLRAVNYLKDNLFIFSVGHLNGANGGFIISPIE